MVAGTWIKINFRQQCNKPNCFNGSESYLRGCDEPTLTIGSHHANELDQREEDPCVGCCQGDDEVIYYQSATLPTYVCNRLVG